MQYYSFRSILVTIYLSHIIWSETPRILTITIWNVTLNILPKLNLSLSSSSSFYLSRLGSEPKPLVGKHFSTFYIDTYNYRGIFIYLFLSLATNLQYTLTVEMVLNKCLWFTNTCILILAQSPTWTAIFCQENSQKWVVLSSLYEAIECMSGGSKTRLYIIFSYAASVGTI